MKSILKRRNDSSGCSNSSSGSSRRQSTTVRPSSASDNCVAEIDAEDVRLSTGTGSVAHGSPWSLPPVARHHRAPVTDELERRIDAGLQRAEQKLERIERQLDSQFQKYERHLRPQIVKEPQTHRSACRESGPRYVTLADGRRWMLLRLDASGYDPRDVRVLVDRNQLLVVAVHTESQSAPLKSPDVTSGYRSDVTDRRLSRRYLLPGYVQAADLSCCMTSDGTLSIDGEMRWTANDRVTSAGGNGGNTSRCSKRVQFDLS